MSVECIDTLTLSASAVLPTPPSPRRVMRSSSWRSIMDMTVAREVEEERVRGEKGGEERKRVLCPECPVLNEREKRDSDLIQEAFSPAPILISVLLGNNGTGLSRSARRPSTRNGQETPPRRLRPARRPLTLRTEPAS